MEGRDFAEADQRCAALWLKIGEAADQHPHAPHAVATDYEGNVYGLGYANLGKYSTMYTLRKYTPGVPGSSQTSIMLWSKDLSRITNSSGPSRTYRLSGTSRGHMRRLRYARDRPGSADPADSAPRQLHESGLGWTRATQRYQQPFFIDAAPNGQLVSVGTHLSIAPGSRFTYLDLPVSKYAK